MTQENGVISEFTERFVVSTKGSTGFIREVGT